jgi:hypothetical protein
MATRDTAPRSQILQVRLRPSEAEALRKIAERDDEPVSQVVRRAIRNQIKQGGKDHGKA